MSGNPHTYKTRKDGREEVYVVARLWRLTAELPVEDVPIESLDLDRAVWFHGRCPKLTEVLKHFEKVLAADLDYPIILSAEGKIMDGFHRLMKARLQGLRTIDVVRFTVDPEPDEVRAIDDPAR